MATGTGQSLGSALEGLSGLVGRIADLIPPAQELLVGTCFVLGIILAVSAIRGFAAVSEAGLNGMNSRYAMAAPLMTAIVALLLISLSSTISAFLMTFFQTSQTVSATEIFSYAPDMLKPLNTDQARQVVIGLLRIIQFIGLIGFIRGLFLLNKSVYAPRQGLAGFGVTHLVGGVLAMNIVQFTGMIQQLVIGS